MEGGPSPYPVNPTSPSPEVIDEEIDEELKKKICLYYHPLVSQIDSTVSSIFSIMDNSNANRKLYVNYNEAIYRFKLENSKIAHHRL